MRCQRFPAGAAGVSLLTLQGSDWYLSADNSSLGGGAGSGRTFQASQWVREEPGLHEDRGAEPCSSCHRADRRARHKWRW